MDTADDKFNEKTQATADDVRAYGMMGTTHESQMSTGWQSGNDAVDQC